MLKIRDINKKRGFSFVELMIAVSIFALLSTVTIGSYANFNNRIGVDTLAHQIAQFGHEAQVSALSVKRAYDGNYPGYGIHFDSASTTQFVFFADLDGNKTYTESAAPCGTATSECEKKVNLLKEVSIVALCGNASSGGIVDSQNCTSVGLANKSYSFDIVFKRPNPDANIIGRNSLGGSDVPYSAAQVIISSNKGYKKSVQFYITGQVTVK